MNSWKNELVKEWTRERMNESSGRILRWRSRRRRICHPTSNKKKVKKNIQPVFRIWNCLFFSGFTIHIMNKRSLLHHHVMTRMTYPVMAIHLLSLSLSLSIWVNVTGVFKGISRTCCPYKCISAHLHLKNSWRWIHTEFIPIYTPECDFTNSIFFGSHLFCRDFFIEER